jgi:hypothetical protein
MPFVLRARLWPALLVLGTGVVSAAQAPSQDDADRMGKKMQAIVMRALAPPAKAAPLRTTFTDRELNAYLAHHAKDQLPAGVKHVAVTMIGVDTLETRSVVDLDAIRTAQPRGYLDPLAYVRGSLQVVTVGTLTGRDGQGVYSHVSGSVDGVPIPRTVMQELLAFYTRSPELPNGLHLDEPFALPAAIREVQVRKGAATVIQ